MGDNRRLIFSIIFFVVVLLVGAYIYQNLEGWSFLDSIYFVVVTVTTLGYGDLVPSSSVGKVFTIFFSFFGIAMAFYMFSLISHKIFRKHLTQKIKDIGRAKNLKKK